MADPATQEPHPCREYVAARVIGNDLGCGAYADAAQKRGERIGVGQWVAAVRAGVRAREIALGVGEKRTRNMRFVILTVSKRIVGQRMTAIDDHPRRIIEMRRERDRVYERSEGHL